MLAAGKDQNGSPRAKESEGAAGEKLSFKDILKVIVTGSKDGVATLGKPQHDWATGKPMAKRREYNWNNKPNSQNPKGQDKK